MDPYEKVWLYTSVIAAIALVFIVTTIILAVQGWRNTATVVVVHATPLPPRVTLTTGVNVGSFLNIEDFFHASSQYVRDVSGVTGGGRLWPVLDAMELAAVLNDATGFSSEGDLFKKLVALKGGVQSAAAILHQFRREYYTEHDFRDMQQVGVKKIRLPMGWWILADANADGVVVDPYSQTGTELWQVPAEPRLMETILDWCSEYHIEVMLDLHAMPGGSSEGSYSGVQGVQNPIFWDRVAKDHAIGVEDQGIKAWKKTMAWRESLSPRRRSVITGLQPMNEPALHIKSNGIMAAVLGWSELAVEAFKEYYNGSEDVPDLFMNFHEVPFVGADFNEETHRFMMQNLGGVVTPKNFVLDVHSYMAWPGTQSKDDIHTYLAAFEAMNMARKSRASGGYRLATSEYSAAFHHTSSECLPDPDWIALLFQGQEQSMAKHGIESYFWSWRCSSMEHKNYWDFRTVLDILPSSNNHRFDRY